MSVFKILVGEILLVEPGDVIPADGILISGINIKSDESSVTGESEPIKKDTENDPFLISGSSITEGLGKYVVTGVGEHSYFGKTMLALTRKIYEGLQVEVEDTPLQQKLDVLAEQIAKFGAAIAITMFVVLLIKFIFIVATTIGFGESPEELVNGTEFMEKLVEILISAITIVVVAVPEGLPLAVTLSLAYATTRMLQDNNLVRVRAACETMGDATTICSDKTGTLTQNKMTVVKGIIGHTVTFSSEIEIKELNSWLPSKNVSGFIENSFKSDIDIFHIIKEGIAINSSVFESKNAQGDSVYIGSKTEAALIEWMEKIYSDISAIRQSTSRKCIQVYPFSSDSKSMATVLLISPDAQNKQSEPIYRVHVKGASEIVLSFCDKVAVLPKERDAGPPELVKNCHKIQKSILSQINEFAQQSLRTIGIAYQDFTETEFHNWLEGDIRQQVMEAIKNEKIEATRKIEQSDGVILLTASISSASVSKINENEMEDLTDETVLAHCLAQNFLAFQGLTFLCLVGIEDPLRPGVTEAIEKCKMAGVFVRMVTGDNLLTAKAIATQCGILTRGGVVMEGSTFRTLEQTQLDAILPRLQVLARSSPLDKQILAARLKEIGETVAVTGDGTNDGPALKTADVGFSMGISGTEVAKEASSIVLMDDNFSSIVKAIMWGRSVNDSVKKFLQFQLTVNIAAVVVAFVTALADAGEKSVLTAVQLLWVNLIMDTLAALALATEKPQPDILERSPQSKEAPLISIDMWKMILGQSIFQIIINLALYFCGGPLQFRQELKYNPSISPEVFEKASYEYYLLRTICFNTFVLLQLCNQINCRRIDSKINIFEGIHQNPYFICIFSGVLIIQILITQFGGELFSTIGLSGGHWITCILIGLLSLPNGVVIRLIPNEFFSRFMKTNVPETGIAAFESELARSLSPSRQQSIQHIPIHQTLARTKWVMAISSVQSELKVFKTLRGTRGMHFNSSTPNINVHNLSFGFTHKQLHVPSSLKNEEPQEEMKMASVVQTFLEINKKKSFAKSAPNVKAETE
ncbi:hypothetical protein HK096_003381 [Nowakowskiella sp. JEL0078]|nr:hypothetical protein HK096_003381 [Nowakowskiella sp. JEL0078]